MVVTSFQHPNTPEQDKRLKWAIRRVGWRAFWFTFWHPFAGADVHRAHRERSIQRFREEMRDVE